ncbi:2-5a-dependent ribonuclease [Diplodia corticola]|uniref:2-5a-dependent ribonuclease n=1 Tax=Diplodia corticola TaxID=236234 RepID=A0A1J9S3L6_9PEZI|nr:2-5a-dependent ribonuclease [Diplodia corticola]OJD34221.1 2-5a-dependent ribonuclease [Diplodia corticola]
MHTGHLFPTSISAMTALPKGTDAVVRFRTASNRSKLPEPIRMFAYAFEVETDELPWYDEVYNVITASDPDYRPAQAWFGETPFIRTVNLINSMHQLEEPQDSTADLSIRQVVIHCLECNNQLLRLHPNTELQHHPALAHWVKTLLLWDQPDTLDMLPDDSREAQLLRVVIRYIKHILLELSKSAEDAPKLVPAPSSFLKNFKRNDPEPKFNIASYIHVLDKEGIPWREWYKNEISDEIIKLSRGDHWPAQKETEDDASKSPVKDYRAVGAAEFEEWYAPNVGPQPVPSRETAPANISKYERDPGPRQSGEDGLAAEEIVELSQKQPDQAQQMLVNLPIDLASMEIINGVLASGEANLESPVIACNYIQHGLRTLEDSSSNGSTGTNESEEPYFPSFDPEERKRKVKLLVLFIRNLIRRGLVPADSLQYDIQEICVRFAPIKEVRDLKHWFQTGEDF